MTEVALRTTEFLNVKEKYTAWRPVGSAIVVIDEHTLRNKWLEIVCDLVSPKKREDYKMLPGWDVLCQHWTEDLRKEWIELGRPTEQYPLGRLTQDPTAAQGMWNKSIDPQLASLLGKEPLGVENLTNTWLWSEDERKRYFIVVNGDETDLIQVKNWRGFNESYESGKLVIHPRTMIKWDAELSLTNPVKNEILNPDKVVHPRFDWLVSKTYVKTPSVLELASRK